MWKLILGVGIMAIFLAASFVGLPVHATSAMPQRPVLVNVVKNPHWSGFADVAANGSVSMVETSFVLPSVTCNSTSPEEQEMYFFASMDNLVTSNDFEYAGALAFCPAGSSVAYYYAINTPDFYLTTWYPSAGDTIYANITVSDGNFVYNVTDVTSHQSTQVEASDSGATLNSAQVLTDTGNCGNVTVTVDCPLTNFGSIGFGSDHTTVPNTNFATINGHTKAIGKFGSTATLYKGITTNDAGTKVDASTSALSSDRTSFTVTFKRSGP
jgi:hypothetical protein